MQTWLLAKLDHITQEFLAGGGYGGVFEAQYLAYLECLVAVTRGSAAAESLWADWYDVCAKAAPEGEKATCLSNRVTDRAELVTALQECQRRFDSPTRRTLRTPKAKTNATEAVDIFDLLNGDSQ